MNENLTDKGRPEPNDDPLQQAQRNLYAAEESFRAIAGASEGADDRLPRMLKVVEQINAELDVERVLSVASEQVIGIFEAERVFVADVLPDGEIRFRVAATFKGRPVPNPQNEVSHAVIQDVARSREPILVENATADPRFATVSSVLSLQLHSVMAAPLLAHGELLGVVYADNRLISGAFDRHSLDLLGVFANHVGIALRNAQLFADLNQARAELALAERLRAIGEVATFIAHEVKNPLGSIQIMLGHLQERWQEPDVRAKVFDMIPREVQRLNKAVTEMLDYARQTPLLKVPVSLTKLAQSAIAALEPQCERQQVTIVTDFGADVPVVFADGERVREVLLNVLKNGMEAMADAPSKELRVAVSRKDEAHVEVAIEDSGTGIPEAELPRIFEAFRTQKRIGSGIGLALCQKVVREHGGQMTAENIPDGGARFRIVLPLSGA
jgi:signal transduction histidine kinase